MNIFERTLTNLGAEVGNLVRDPTLSALRTGTALPPPPQYATMLEASATEGSEYAGTGINVGEVDYTQIQVGQGGQTNQTAILPWRGNWLAVDRGSIGSPLVSFRGADTDTGSILLTPGRVIKTPFEKIRLFYVPMALWSYWNPAIGNPVSLPPIDPTPKFRCFYGSGDCPFEDSPVVNGSEQPVLLTATNAFAATKSVAGYVFQVPPGAVLNISVFTGKYMPVVGPTKYFQDLHTWLTLGNQANQMGALLPMNPAFLTAPPDTERLFYWSPEGQIAPGYPYPINGNAIPPTYSMVQSTWKNFRVPRGVGAITLTTVDFGTYIDGANDVTNNIGTPFDVYYVSAG